jgi:hypothetical protein
MMSLVTYNFTAQEKQDYINGQDIDLSDKVVSNPISDEGLISDVFNKDIIDTCLYVVVTWCSDEENTGHINGYYNGGGQCNGYQEQNIGSNGCTDNSGGDVTFDPIDLNNPTGTTTNDGYTPHPVGSGGGTTTPVLCEGCEEIEECSSDLAIALITTRLTNLTPEQLSFIENSDNCEQTTAIQDYLADNQNDTSADAFAQQAFVALMDVGEVDFEDEIILDPSILNNPKVLCVYNTLRANSYTNNSNPQSLFNNIMDDYFGGSKNSKIKFEIGNIPTQLGNGIDAFTYADYNATTPTLLSIHPGDVMTVRLNPTFVQNASTLEIALTLIHESIHAELIARGIELGIISEVTQLGHVIFLGNSIAQTIPEMIFNELMIKYVNYNGPPQNPQWQHDLMTVLNYRIKMAQNLLSIHSFLNDANNDFLTNISNDSNIVGGPYTLSQVMDYITWVGLDQTQEYINTISGTSEESKSDYLIGAARSKYTHNCN